VRVFNYYQGKVPRKCTPSYSRFVKIKGYLYENPLQDKT
jgi:hypothetical protein